MTKTTQLPENSDPYNDKYFLRSREILQKKGQNPWVRGQIFIRKGPGLVGGIDQAVEILEKYGKVTESGGKIQTVRDGTPYQKSETLILVDAPIQNIIGLETMYLGVLSAETTKKTLGIDINLPLIYQNMKEVVEAADGRPVTYFGPRHWSWDRDAEIAKACFDAGAKETSTDIGAATVGKVGVGTTPHVLENVYSYLFGQDRAVLETMIAFDQVFDPKIPRIALVDYRNKELDDSVSVANTLKERFTAPRIDTCGENVGQGAIATPDYEALEALTGKRIQIPTTEEKFWFGTGVTITGVYAVRKALMENGHNQIPYLSSGFANPNKIKAFVHAEELLSMQLFSGLGVGQIYQSNAAKMDIVAVGDTADTMIPVSKVGRFYRPNNRLELRGAL